jgi:hypothetical protein
MATRALTARAPWPIQAVLFASASVIVGVIWDISWHRTIGRDTFWTPAHMAIYLGGVVAGLSCGWVALATTFGGASAERDASVHFWGFRAPLGAWVCIWGAFAMVTSAPFDDWWHNAYGLDVKVLSPPHVLLAAGIGAIQCGAMLMALAWQNRHARETPSLGYLFVIGAGLLLVLNLTLVIDYVQRWDMHRSLFYQVTAGVALFILVSSARASTLRWPATLTALVYMILTEIMVIVLPRFPAQPLLGPIYVPIDHFMPPDFPLLLVAPGIAIDLIMQRRRGTAGRDWTLAAILAVAFVAAFVAAQWPFANFLMTPWARNWIFATHWQPYYAEPLFQERWYTLSPPDNLLIGLSIALALGFVSARFGLWWGSWMARVQR